MRNRRELYLILRPCPKCGGDNITTYHHKTFGITTRYAIKCYKCDFELSGRSKRRTIKRWQGTSLKRLNLKNML